ncbi:MAG TPA: glycerophosphodiester phosphodiesterase [Candidatus Angelobacter sp.]|nr:glycerophosphodiester phosphodiesterase [Candidatus Angelobacter sp.]
MSRSFLLLGHRGARDYAPENTIAAFDLALAQGADGFEFDVRSTSDRQSVICHDPKFHRLSIRRSTLKQIHATCASPKIIPLSLRGVLERYSRPAFLNIEIKVRGMEELVIREVRRARPARYFISSFLPGVVRRLHALDASLVLGALAQTRWQLRRWHRLPVQYVVPHYNLLSRRLVKKLHDAGKTVVTWTVNNPRKMLRAAALGVDGIISDDPRLLVETLRGRYR